jgi:hypothetical protein
VTRGTLQSGSPPAAHSSARTGVRGASGDPKRGAYCTPKYVASALGDFDLDPFTNERSHVRAVEQCILDNGGDGFGAGDPGSYRVGQFGARTQQATHATRVWLQPDYTQVLSAVRHYVHTRFVALLRFDPRPEWADLVGGASEWIGVLSNSPALLVRVRACAWRRRLEQHVPARAVRALVRRRHPRDASAVLVPRRHRAALAQAVVALGTRRARWIQSWGLEPELFNLTP